MKARQTSTGQTFAGHAFAGRDSLEDFKRAATAFTERATSSKKQARKVLRDEGILNARGKLSQHYS